MLGSAYSFRSEVVVDLNNARIVRQGLYQDATSGGDLLIRWIVPLHFGTFGGLPLESSGYS
jgi:uncharacterized iron-regulated membrane protein